MRLSQLSPLLVARIKALAFVLSSGPWVMLLIRGFNDALGANPIETVERSLGYWTLTFLMITLSVTPLRRWLGWPWLIRFRRMFGLYAFFYASLHFLAYVGLDNFFDWPAIFGDIAKRPYITVGFPAFVLLIPLAITSTARMIRRLGYARWQHLHRLVYVIAIGGVVHYWWLVKKDVTGPVQFAGVLTLLLGARGVHAFTVRAAARREDAQRR
jgi:methionine sulfoxide reductase heme-binding subunit